jgi:hypothetical protein
MKHLITVLAIAAAAFASSAQATSHKEAPAMTSQQSKMTVCNKDAGDKKGDERKAFMKDCLSKKPEPAPSAKTAQQEKMKTCNKDATGKKGDERKAFMKECLSK